MSWTFDGAEWTAKGTYLSFRVFQSRSTAGWRAEVVATGRGQTYTTLEGAKEWCEGEDHRSRH